VFRYSGRHSTKSGVQEDWMNDVAPSLMFFRSYIRCHKLKLSRLTLDAQGVSFLDFSDPSAIVGRRVVSGAKMKLVQPTNVTSSVRRIRRFVDAASESLGDD
jgi:hypothetical protein